MNLAQINPTIGTLVEGRATPSLVAARPAGGVDQLIDWITTHHQRLEDLVHQAGVVLLRGFMVSSVKSFRSVCAAVRPALQNYTGGDSPRRGLADQVYTSTEYPAHLEVLLHNELSYAGWSPERVFFCCLKAAATGGETHVADGREIYRRLDRAVRQRFESRGITYLQHLWDGDGPPGIGKSWQQTFETDSRDQAQAYLVSAGMRFEWTDLGLRTAADHAAVLTHPVTGQKCWHNQADQWHRDMPGVKVSIGEGATDRQSGQATLGNHMTFGDGSGIALADLEHVRAVSRQCEAVFPWQTGDVMVIDNVLAMHGRKPFTGKRKVIVAMA